MVLLMNSYMGIIQNAVRCLGCDTIVVSLTSHDRDVCKCGKVMVDGGSDYLRSSGNKEGETEELYLWENSTDKEFKEKLIWGTRTGTDNSVVFKKIKDLDTSHIEAILNTQTQISEMRKQVFVTELRRRKIHNIT
jgi:hypothetical protein